jgi:hypothetical protein
VKGRNRTIKWRCDKCRECVATVKDGQWLPSTDEDSDSRRSVKRSELRLSHYEERAKYDPDIAPYGQWYEDFEPPAELEALPLASLSRDDLLYGLCPRHGIREVRVAAVRQKTSR